MVQSAASTESLRDAAETPLLPAFSTFRSRARSIARFSRCGSLLDGAPPNFSSPCKDGKLVSSSSNYLYFCECIDGQQLVNTHRVVVRKHSKLRHCISYTFSLLLVLGFSYSIIFSVISVAVSAQWLILIIGAASLIRQRNAVAEEVVVVMPTFGVQLETSYGSGKVLRRFVPLKQILAAVINEAVTPTSCYYYLALLLRDDSKLVLAFKGVRPPLVVLVPIWKSLCEAINN